MADKTIKDIEGLADRLDAFADGDVLEARRDALHGQPPEQEDYEAWADLMKQAASALRQLLNAQKWREIETAPKTGRVLLWLADEGFSMIGHWDAKEEMWRLPEWDMWTGEHGMHQLTHWLPLPSPPKEPSDV